MEVPTYGYECELCKAEFEVMQRISDDPLTTHDGCGGTLRRKLYPVGIVFKGPGFHVNDYGPKRNGKDTETKSAKAAEAKPDAPAAESKPAESKAAPATTTT